MNNVVIMLTCTVNIDPSMNAVIQQDPDERIATYIRSINHWIIDSSFNIVIVENSGYKFSEIPYNERVEIISFMVNDIAKDDDKKLLYQGYNGKQSKGQHELFAINYAYNNSMLIQNSEVSHVIKITGRYYIPNFDQVLRPRLRDNIAMIVQQEQHHCMVVGSSKATFSNVFRFPCSIGRDQVEEDYVQRKRALAKTDPLSVLILPRLRLLYPTKQGGVKKVHTHL